MGKIFTISFTEEFETAFNALVDSVKKLVEEHIRIIKEKPRVGKKLKGSQYWSDRVGSLRIIYVVDWLIYHVNFIILDKRSRVYDRL